MIDNRVEVSLRFRLCLEAKIRQLEEDAILDAHIVSGLESEDHRRRQCLLVNAQLERARVLRELLVSTRLRNLVTA